MAVTTEQKVDFLLKKIGYSLSKTGSVVGTGAISGSGKQPWNESLPSPLVVPDSSIWNQSLSIPTTPPGSTTSIVHVYSTSSALRMTADSTSSGSRAFIAYTTYNNTSSARLTDWIDTQFGTGYVLKVYKGDPNSSGTLLPAGGSGSNDKWFFDYSSGVLNFNDTSIPSGVNDTNIYIVGYRYVGSKGVSSPGTISPTNLYVSGISTFAGDVYANANLTVAGLSTFTGAIDANGGANIAGGLVANSAQISDLTSGRVTYAGGSGELQDSGNLTFDGTDLTAASAVISDLTDNRVVIAGSSGALEDDSNLTFNGTTLSVGVNLDVDGHTELDFVNVSAASTLAGIVDVNGTLNVDGHVEADDVNVSGMTSLAQAEVGDLAQNSVVYAGSGGRLKDSSNLKFTDTKSEFEVVGHSVLDTVVASGIVTAGQFSTGASGVGINIVGSQITGPAELFIDPAAVGDNTGKVRIKGDLYVDGTTFSVHEGDIEFGDFVVGIASTVPTNALLDGAGIGIGSTGIRKFIRYNHASTSLQSSIDFSVPDGNAFKTGTANVLNKTTLGSTVVNSSLQNLGTLTGLTVNGSSTLTRIVVGSAVTANSTGVFVTGVTTSTSLVASSTLVAASAKISDLTDDRVVVAGASGELEDSANLTFNGNTLNVVGHVETDTFNVSGVSTFAGAVDINNAVNISSGLVVNSGATLDSAQVSDLTNNRVVIVGASGELEDSSNLTFDGSTLGVTGSVTATSSVVGSAVTSNATGVIVSGVTTSISLVASSTLVAGSAKVSDLTDNRVVIAGTGGELEDSGNLTFNGSTLGVTGAVTATSSVVGSAVTSNATGVIVTGVTTSNSFVGALTGNSTTATDLAINATQRIIVQTGNNATDVLPAGSSGQVLQSAGSGSSPVWANAAAGGISGVTVKDEGSTAGTVGIITTLNFVGSAVEVDAAVSAGIATVTVTAEDPVAMAIALG